MQLRTKGIVKDTCQHCYTAAQILQWNDADRARRNQGNAAVRSLDVPAISPFRSPGVEAQRKWKRHGILRLNEAATLYEWAVGEPPNEVIAAGRAVLIETGVVGSYADFPNGYVPILISRTPDGFVVFDTGQNAPKQEPAPEGVLREGATLYVKTDNEPEALQRGIRTLVNALRWLQEGRCY
ncbi:MAG: hypothetical protein F4089_16135 [Gammaproteobacteria bacterium]|nr:hypothetical protein [Gammaproteobacteria bacterium]